MEKQRQSRVLLGVLVSVASLVPSAARAEIIKFDDMRRGTTVTAAQCASTKNAVWVSAYGRNVCMRYFLSDAGGSGQQVTFFLNGDKPGTMPNQKVQPEDVKDTDTEILERRAGKISRDLGQPAIYLARMGLDGSSGHHAQRRTNLELHITNAAIEAIKRRHGFTTVNLFGQSGGSTLIGSLLSLRNDVNCAVSGSGRLVAKASSIRENATTADPALRIINPSDGLAKIVRTSRAKIMVVTDPNDQRVTREHQDPFVKSLQKAGRQVDQFYVAAKDPLHHGVSKFAQTVTRECLRGSSHDEIARALTSPSSTPHIAERPSHNPDRPRETATVSPKPSRHEPAKEQPARPTEQAKTQGKCRIYVAQIGMTVSIPCEQTAARN
jgi:hypothetical protein